MSVANHAKHEIVQSLAPEVSSVTVSAVGLEDAICLSEGINCGLRSGLSDTVVQITSAVTLEGRLIGSLYI